MKLELIRHDIKVAPGVPFNETQMVKRDGGTFFRCGAIIEANARECELLVGNGDCIPACDESRAVCVGWEAKLELRKVHREMLARGIAPEDRQRYLRGEIVGYDENGDDIPGPNYVESDEGDE